MENKYGMVGRSGINHPGKETKKIRMKPLYSITIDVYPDRIETWSQKSELTKVEVKQYMNLLTRVWDLVEEKQSKQLTIGSGFGSLMDSGCDAPFKCINTEGQ